MRTRAASLMVATFAVLLVLTGCLRADPIELVATDVVGEWVYQAPSGHESVLSFDDDGSFWIDQIPRSILVFDATPAEIEEWNDPVGVSGRWSLDGDKVGIQYSFDGEVEGQGTSLFYRDRSDARAEIFTYVGDPDEGFEISWVARD